MRSLLLPTTLAIFTTQKHFDWAKKRLMISPFKMPDFVVNEHTCRHIFLGDSLCRKPEMKINDIKGPSREVKKSIALK